MENRPIITLNGVSLTPGVDSEIWERFLKWCREVYFPMLLALPGRSGVDQYTIIKESAEYPSVIILIHLESFKALQDSLNNPARTAVLEDLVSWVRRRVTAYFWSKIYALIKSLRSEPLRTPHKEETMIEGAPFLHIEGYRLPPEDKDKFERWLDDYAFSAFIPLMMKLPGVKGYSCYKDSGLKGSGIIQPREWDYPDYISLLYFENQKAFEDYTKSPELLAFQKAIYNVFPNGLNLKWYVQYQLIKSYRK